MSKSKKKKESASKTSRSKPQTGLSITRNGMNFDLKWTRGETYSAQKLRYGIGHGWVNWPKGIGAGTTAKTLALSTGSFYPRTQKYLTKVGFEICGRAKKSSKDKKEPSFSDWAQKFFTVRAPRTPSVSGALDGTVSAKTTFSWNTITESNDAYILTDVLWQSVLTTSYEGNGAKLNWSASASGWQTGTGSASGSKGITETVANTTNGSHTRWFRCIARGPAGNSNWAYAKHVYAAPYTPTISRTQVWTNASGGTDVHIWWKCPQDNGHPIDKIGIKYAFETPNADMSIPSGTEGTDCTPSGQLGGSDNAVVHIDDRIGENQCLYVRVYAQHDGNESPSAWIRVSTAGITAPAISSLSVTSTNFTIEATKGSGTPDGAKLAIVQKTARGETVLGVLADSGELTINYALPGDYVVGVYTFLGSYASAGNGTYTVKATMWSSRAWKSGTTPKVPESVTVESTDAKGKVRVNWDWTWAEATSATVSWSDDRDGWDSSDDPDDFQTGKVTSLYVPNLETGKTWYFRVRLSKTENGDTVDGPWSDIVSINLASAPAVPVLTLSAAVIPHSGTITATWTYTSTDGTSQGSGEVYEAMIDDTTGAITYGTESLGHTDASQTVTITPPSTWADKSVHYLAARVSSASGRMSEWSAPQSIMIADPPTVTIADTLKDATVPADDDDGTTRTVLSLTVMPLTVTITGAGASGTTILTIERAEEFHIERPDGTRRDGYEGETIYAQSQLGEGAITVTQDDLIGLLDDDGKYRIVATVKDDLGQAATATKNFEVHWEHQAGIPDATVTDDRENMISIIEPTAPDTYAEGDVCDIYRLSADAPELIISGGAFGTKYVDPYPAFGDSGGHRVVCRTSNGDYITADNETAWIDVTGEGDDRFRKILVVDFNGERILLPYNVTSDNSWKKDFKQTVYLGGAIQGDWNPGVTRKLTCKTDYDETMDRAADTIEALRRLAVFAGICHVRTPDGSSFAADVQVAESRSYGTHRIGFTLTINGVDPEGLEGMTLADWKAMQE